MYLDQEINEVVSQLGEVLSKENKMLITAESCTGGLIGAACTDIAGSSAWFYGGIISYDNKAKETILGVSKETLSNEGAVSITTVEQMCIGALQIGGDISVAVSGVAGPAGGSPGKPVGTVIIGSMLRGKAPYVQRFHFEGDRVKIRELTVINALKATLTLIENEKIKKHCFFYTVFLEI